jgi:trigger factor
MKAEQKKMEKSQIEITFELTADEFKEHFSHALEHLKHHVKVDGFREGKAPASMVEDKLKPEALLMEAGDHAVKHVYFDYVSENKLEPVGNPEISIIKIAKGSEFIFKAIITLLPEVVLPDYKEIASKVKNNGVSVSDQEIQDTLNYLQKSRAKFTPKKEPAEKKDFVNIIYQSKDLSDNKEFEDKFVLGEGGFMKDFEENIEGMKEGAEKIFKVAVDKNFANKDLIGKEMEFKVKLKAVSKMEVPEINDQFAKEVSGEIKAINQGKESVLSFDTLEGLKDSIKTGILSEKKEAQKQKHRDEILEKIVEKVSIELPDSVIAYEQENLMRDLKNRVSQSMKITFEQYLATTKQTEEQLKESFKKEAEKRIKKFLILREIGKKENVEVSEKEVTDEIEKAILGYQGQDKSKFDINQFKEYTKDVLMNEKIFQLLENLSH